MTPQAKKIGVITISLLALGGLSYYAYTYMKKKGDAEGTASGDQTNPDGTSTEETLLDKVENVLTGSGRATRGTDKLPPRPRGAVQGITKDEAKKYTLLFQKWYNGYGLTPKLVEDGIIGKNTKGAIAKYKTQFGGYLLKQGYTNAELKRIDDYIKVVLK